MSRFLFLVLFFPALGVCATSAQEPPGGGWTVSDQRELFADDCYAPSVLPQAEGGVWIFFSRMPPKGRGTIVLKSKNGVGASEQEPVAEFQDITSVGVARFPEGLRFYYSVMAQAGSSGSGPLSDRIVSRLWESGKEPAVRAGTGITCPSDLNLGRPAVIRLRDGAWRMFFTEWNGNSDHANLEPVRIFAASSADGIAWTRDPQPCIVATPGGSGSEGITGPVHPTVLERAAGGYWMFYNLSGHLHAAWSADGRAWRTLGPTGADGQDADAYVQSDGSIRIYICRTSETGHSGIHTAVLREKSAAATPGK